MIVDSITPNSGSIITNMNLTIRGYGFDSVIDQQVQCIFTGVTFDEYDLDIIYMDAAFVSSNIINCLTPTMNLAQYVTVEIGSKSNPQFTSESGILYYFYDEIELISVSPQKTQLAGGDKLLITGNNFLYSDYLQANNLQCRFTMDNSSLIANGFANQVLLFNVKHRYLILPVQL